MCVCVYVCARACVCTCLYKLILSTDCLLKNHKTQETVVASREGIRNRVGGISLFTFCAWMLRSTVPENQGFSDSHNHEDLSQGRYSQMIPNFLIVLTVLISS